MEWYDATRRDLVVIDLETTGRYTPPHRICEIGMVRMRQGRIIDEWVTLINPDRPTGPEHVHHIMGRDVASAPRFADVAYEVLRRMAGATIVAHAAAFEEQFLAHEFAQAGIAVPVFPALCTHELDRVLRPESRDHRLGAACAAWGVPLVDSHTALGDARATAWILPQMLRRARELGCPPRSEFVPPNLPDFDVPPVVPTIRASYGLVGPGAAVADSEIAPAWYPDPRGGHTFRWWDGHAWSSEVASPHQRIVAADEHPPTRDQTPTPYGSAFGRP
jgi:DNA polymerase III epsilon subunit family exonuclease